MPVKKSVSELPEVSNEPPKKDISGSTTTTFTSSEKTLPSPVTKTETYSKSWGPSNDNTELKTTTITTVTTLNSANDNKKTPSNTQDSFYDSPFSPGVYISPVSQKSSPPNILSYRSSQSKYDAGTESETASSELRSSTVSSSRSTTTTFTSSEKTLPSPVTKTETYSKSWGPSNDNTELKTTTITTATTLNSANDNKKTPSNTQDSFDDNLFSPGVYISPVSEQSSPPNILSYRSSQSKYDAGMTLRQTPTLSPTMYSSAATPSLSQATTTRTVSKRDLCTVCGKCITGEGRMILEDLQIFSHSSCFKCELCRISLGALEAGDSLWVYKGMVHCDNCYKKTKAQWFR
ncbi:sciellin [Electrophorus electricus]|uniref:sciellin n=1 Tax=Electrophorus electricus TaxID=8005 RepID=UPI0015D038CE|nr:sciellin [Electrophorus electricus]